MGVFVILRGKKVIYAQLKRAIDLIQIIKVLLK